MASYWQRYQARLINPVTRRRRATQGEMQERRDALFEIAEAMHPIRVRQAYYQCEVRGVPGIGKDDAGYAKVQQLLVEMREDGTIPYEWVVDSTRMIRRPWTYLSPTDAIRRLADEYRLDYWQDAAVQVQLWLEKDALLDIVRDVTDPRDVPLLVARGFSSHSHIRQASQDINRISQAAIERIHKAADGINGNGKAAYIGYLADYDPWGQQAARHTEKLLRQWVDVPLIFEMIAVLPEQMEAWSLPTRPTKRMDTRLASEHGPVSCELDAIDPNRLRDLVRGFIERFQSAEMLEQLQAEEQRHQEMLRRWARRRSA
jgi:hypothetical protein